MPASPPHTPCLGLSELAKSAWQATAEELKRGGGRSAVRPLAGAKQKSNVMFMSCYLILRVLLYSAASATVRFISFHLLFAFFFSLSFFVRFAFVRFLFLFVWKYFTYTDISHRALINSSNRTS